MAKINHSLIVLCLLLVFAPPLSAGPREPFTPAGASRIEVKAGGATGFLFKPAKVFKSAGQPWVWYAPTLLREKPPLPNASTHWLFKRLLARGIWIAGVDVGESYGSPAGRKIFSEFYKDVTSQFHLSTKPCLLVQSRGGLMGIGWAEEHPADVRCIAGIYPAVNLTSWPPRDSARFKQAAVAFGYASPAEFQKHLIDLSPLSHLAPLAKAGVPVFILHGDADRIVPLGKNSRPLVAAYTALGGSAKLIVVHGKGHEEVDEFFKSRRILAFLLDHSVDKN